MFKRGSHIALVAVLIAVGCSEVKKSDDDDNQGGSNANVNGGDGGDGGDGGSGGSGAEPDGGSGMGAGDGGSGGGDAGGDGGSGGDGAGGDGGSGGSGGDGASGTAAVDAGPVNGIPCGQKICSEFECCSDPFASVCGAPLPTTANTCLPPPPEDAMAIEGCPSINIVNIFSLPSCCTEDGQCGINASSFGSTSPCTDLATARMRAEEMGAGAFIPFPEPQACPDE